MALPVALYLNDRIERALFGVTKGASIEVFTSAWFAPKWHISSHTTVDIAQMAIAVGSKRCNLLERAVSNCLGRAQTETLPIAWLALVTEHKVKTDGYASSADRSLSFKVTTMLLLGVLGASKLASVSRAYI
jgi:hypothetical protein